MKSGDTVRVHVKVREGDKERIQIFEGIVIGLHRGGARASFTVRKVSFGQGVERIFPLHSPTIAKVDVVRSARVRRAKLYFLRDLKGKAARMKETKRTKKQYRGRRSRSDEDPRERHAALGVPSRRRLSTKWAAAAWPVPSSPAAVILDPERYIPGLCDSKMITALERERLYGVITRKALAWSVASAPARRNR